MYRLTLIPSTVQRIADGAFIPADAPDNRDCAEYIAWLADGNTPEPAPAPPFNRDAAMTRLRKIRGEILNALAGIGFDAVAAGDTALRDAVAAARQGLKDITKHPAILAATNDAAFNAAAKVRYAQLAAAAPAAVQVAFREATQ